MSLKKKAISGLVWTYFQQFGSQGINFIVNLVLARLLFPSDFGTISLLYVFVAISSVLIDGGMSASLIRKKNTTEEDFNTIFIINIFSAIFLYIIIYIISPYVEDFYEADNLSNVLRVYSICLLISSFGVVQRAILRKKMAFKRETLISLPSIVVSGILGIILAFKGFGLWSLVWSALMRELVNVLQLWFYSDWKPQVYFNKEKFLSHFHFGYKFTLIEIIRAIFTNIFPMIIGKGFSLSEAGLFKQAETLRLLPFSNIVSSINKVAFPLYAEIQDDNLRLKSLHSKLTVILFTIMCPIFIYMAVLSKDIIVLVFTDKWIEAAPFLSILSIGSLISVVNINNLNVLNVRGKMNIILKIELIERVFFVTLLVICLVFQLGIFVLLFSEIVRGILSAILKDYYCSKELHTPFGKQLLRLFPPLLSTLGSAITVFYFNVIVAEQTSSIFLRVAAPVFLGLLIYVLLIYLLKKSLLLDIVNLIKKKQ